MTIVHPVVHLELRTGNLARACAFYTQLFGWTVEPVRAGARTYHALQLAAGVEGGVVEHQHAGAAWLPYVEVADVAQATGLARELGAVVLVEPREGPAGWRSVLAAPAGARVALWQPKL